MNLRFLHGHQDHPFHVFLRELQTWMDKRQ
jgi:hypothetical protein